LAWLDSVHPDDRSRAESVRLRGVGGEGGQESIYRVLQPDGEVRWARDRRFPILERGPSRTDRVAVLTEDITLRVNAERAALQLQARLRSLASELVLTEEHERRRLAEALHDSLGQSLSLVRIKLGEMRRAEGAPTAQSGLTEVMSIIDDALESVQTMTFDLCPRGLHDLGFVQATRWLADDLASRFGLEVEVQVQGRERPIEERIRIIVFRSMRELLINVAKHARSRSASISLALSPSSLTVTVSDGGAGFDPDELHSAPRQAESFGLFSVRQHLVELGGDMQIEAAPGEGTRVVLSVPLSATGSSRTLRAPA
jgi:signal transduction histidine kinase